jgi:two-component system chemotaxis sensor kinase CheA
MDDSPSENKNELLDSLLGDFLDESDQLLSQLNRNLLQLDEWAQAPGEDPAPRCDEGLLNEMFRAAHSLKGLSAMLGLTDINHLTHKIENVFDAARHDELPVTRDVTELIFMGLDQLTAMIGLLKEPSGEPVDCNAVVESIRRILQTAGVEHKPTTQADAERALRTATAGQAAGDAGKGDSPHLCDDQRCASVPASGPVRQMGTVPFFHSDTTGDADPFQGLKDEEDIPENYLSMFLDEAEAALDALTSGLLAVEGGSGNRAGTGQTPSGGSQGPAAAGGQLKSLLGAAHKIKGSAASVGLNRAAKLAHLMEDLLEKAVATGSRLSVATTDLLLRSADGLRQHVTDLRRGGRGSCSFGPLGRDLVAAQSSQAVLGTGDPPEPPVTPQTDTHGGAAPGRTTYVGEVTFPPDLPTGGLKAQLIYEKLIKLGELGDCQPPPERLETTDHLEYFRFRLTTEQSAETVAAQLRVGGVLQARVQPLPPPLATAEPVAEKKGAMPLCVPPPAAAPPAAEAAPESPPSLPPPEVQRPSPEAGQRATAAGQRPAETVRVETDRLDQLMDLAGQLVINKAQFAQVGERLKAVAGCNQAVRAIEKLGGELDKLGACGALRVDGQHLVAELESVQGQVRRIRNDLEPIRREVETLSKARDFVRELFEAIHQLDRVSDGIQKGVMGIRMVPIGPLFSRFHRVVRDISRAGGKQVRLEIVGEKTELDKRMIDELGDPLVHLVRNSADHGIESPEERQAAGKPRQGTVTLDAFHRGNSIVIEVRDDGQGLDTDRILRKALDKGLVAEADAPRMTAHQIQQLIWKPGLSTAAKVTDISGRGMGMDIVKTKIQELSGTAEISSERGKGTTITIKLPLTLAILPSLMVDIAGDVFAMPMEAVTEIVSIGRNGVHTVHGRPMATVRGRVIPLVMLGDLLSFSRAGGNAGFCSTAETTLVVVSDASREVGLAVDRVIGEEDVVIKSIADNYQNVPGIAGASILGDGRVALILDIPALIAALSKRAAPATR